MKLIHCADLHLDAQMNTHLDKARAKERRAELLVTFEKMVAFAAEQEVEGILIAGDLFDTKHISATARQTVLDAIKGNPKISFYYLKGNHDSDNFLADVDELPENLFLFGDTWTGYELGMDGKVILTGVELKRHNNERIYRELVLDASKINLVMLHGQESGSAAHDKTDQINLYALRGKGIDYLALGHVHFYKEAQLDARGVYCYPGCLEGRGFDECGEHGFVLLDIDEEAGTIQRSFIPSGGRSIYAVPVDVTDCMNTNEMAVRMDAALADCGADSRSLVKVMLRGSIPVECEKDLVFLEKRIEQNYYYVTLADETEYYFDASDYNTDKSLRGEFVRTVMAQKDLSEEDKNQIIRYGLQAIAGEEIGL